MELSNDEAKRRGRKAKRPRDIPWQGWKDIGKRVVTEFSDDRVMLTAAGATFYLLLALFPALTAFVSLYGVVLDPKTIADHIALLGALMPSAGVDIIATQIEKLVSQELSTLSFGFVLGLAIAVWSANSGIKSLFAAMNIAYDESERRGFIKLNLISLAFTVAGLVIGILFLVSVGVVPAVLAFAGLADHTEWLISLLRWPVLFATCWAGISIIYRYGPSRVRAEWRWVVWGASLTTAVWLLASMLFSWYLANFADYGATYGSLGAVIGFMMWMWVSLIIFILGAELNAEIEHQTALDSTVGPDKPMGERGAVMADTVGKPYHMVEPSSDESLQKSATGGSVARRRAR